MHNSVPHQELWGEFTSPKSGPALSLTQQEREALGWMPKPLSLEGPRIHQPVGGEKSSGPTFASSKETQIQDDWVLGGIRLLNFKSELQNIHENLIIKKERTGTTGFALPPIEIPLLPPPVTPREGSRLKGGGLFGDYSPVKRDTKEDVKWHLQDKGEEEPGAVESPPLSATVVRQLMHKSVAAISAFYGYDQSTDEALNILTDVACDFSRQFCQMLRLSRDNQLLGNSSGFADVMERTYRDMNLGSILDMRQFYTQSVVGRYKAIRKECKKLIEECQSMEDSNVAKFGNSFTPNVCSVSADTGSIDNIPEIHLPSSEEGDNGILATFSLDHNTPQMETGLQMLQSLEQGTYANLAATDVSIGDPDSGHLHHQQPLSHDSNSGILMHTPSPHRKRRKT